MKQSSKLVWISLILVLIIAFSDVMNSIETAVNQSKTGSSTKGQITLILYIHNGDANGPVISGAHVSGHDSVGNSFQANTSDLGFATITGIPGRWSFGFSAPGFNINTLTQYVNYTTSRHVYLQPKTEPNHRTLEEEIAYCEELGGSFYGVMWCNFCSIDTQGIYSYTGYSNINDWDKASQEAIPNDRCSAVGLTKVKPGK